MNVLEARRRLLGAGVYKKAVTGNPAVARGSLARMYPGIEMQGWTEQDSTTGAQLFDEKLAPTYTTNGITVEWLESEKCFLFNGTSTATIATESYINLPATKGNNYTAQTVYISGSVTAPEGKVSGAYFGASDEENTKNNWLFASFVNQLNSRTAICNYDYITAFWFYIDANITFNNYKVRVMLNEGATALPYEPYTGGAPSPSPDYPQEIVSAGEYDEANGKYNYEIRMGGKNLFDTSIISDLSQGGATLTNNGDGSFTITGTGELAANFANTMYISGDEARKFLKTGTLYSNQTGKVPQFYVYAVDSNRNSLFTTASNGECEITEDMLGKINRFYYAFYSVKGRTITPGVVWPMVWQYGDDTWEPYKSPQTVTLTSDRPLTKWDKLTKKAGVWGWEYKSVEKQLESDFPRIGYDGQYFNFNSFLQADIIKRTESLCNCLIYNQNVTNDNCFWIDSTGTGLRIKKDDIISVDAMRTWLLENDVIVLYPADTETFVSLTASEQEQMNALHTNRPTTVLSNNQNCDMSLTYKTRKSMEVTT